jgi:hypothetical protein
MPQVFSVFVAALLVASRCALAAQHQHQHETIVDRVKHAMHMGGKHAANSVNGVLLGFTACHERCLVTVDRT